MTDINLTIFKKSEIRASDNIKFSAFFVHKSSYADLMNIATTYFGSLDSFPKLPFSYMVFSHNPDKFFGELFGTEATLKIKQLDFSRKLGVLIALVQLKRQNPYQASYILLAKSPFVTDDLVSAFANGLIPSVMDLQQYTPIEPIKVNGKIGLLVSRNTEESQVLPSESTNKTVSVGINEIAPISVSVSVPVPAPVPTLPPPTLPTSTLPTSTDAIKFNPENSALSSYYKQEMHNSIQKMATAEIPVRFNSNPAKIYEATEIVQKPKQNKSDTEPPVETSSASTPTLADGTPLIKGPRGAYYYMKDGKKRYYNPKTDKLSNSEAIISLKPKGS